jgi:hypothetical protein
LFRSPTTLLDATSIAHVPIGREAIDVSGAGAPVVAQASSIQTR